MGRKRGRPKKINKLILQKLEAGFLYGFSDEEACMYAEIGTSTLYDYCKAHPEFSERKEQLKQRPKMRAKINVVKAMDGGDLDTSKWYLERKAKDEFSAKLNTEITGDVSVANPLAALTDEELRRLANGPNTT